MNISELWRLYEADKRIQGFSPSTLKAYALQFKILLRELGDLNTSEVTLNLLKEYLAKQSDQLKPSSLGHFIVLILLLAGIVFLKPLDYPRNEPEPINGLDY